MAQPGTRRPVLTVHIRQPTALARRSGITHVLTYTLPLVVSSISGVPAQSVPPRLNGALKWPHQVIHDSSEVIECEQLVIVNGVYVLLQDFCRFRSQRSCR